MFPWSISQYYRLEYVPLLSTLKLNEPCILTIDLHHLLSAPHFYICYIILKKTVFSIHAFPYIPHTSFSSIHNFFNLFTPLIVADRARIVHHLFCNIIYIIYYIICAVFMFLEIHTVAYCVSQCCCKCCN